VKSHVLLTLFLGLLSNPVRTGVFEGLSPIPLLFLLPSPFIFGFARVTGFLALSPPLNYEGLELPFLPSVFVFDVLFAILFSLIEAVGKPGAAHHQHIRLLNSASFLVLEL
jgi:hypothetical protein